MYALIVKDSRFALGFKVFSRFNEFHSDELQKVVVTAKIEPVLMRGMGANEKTILPMLFSTYEYAKSESERFNKITLENTGEVFDYEVMHISDLCYRIQELK